MPPSHHPQSQRDVMRRLYREYGGNEALVVAAYARAETAGEVQRKRDKNGLTPEEYAKALFRDGEKKGWLLVTSLRGASPGARGRR